MASAVTSAPIPRLSPVTTSTRGSLGIGELAGEVHLVLVHESAILGAHHRRRDISRDAASVSAAGLRFPHNCESRANRPLRGEFSALPLGARGKVLPQALCTWLADVELSADRA